MKVGELVAEKFVPVYEQVGQFVSTTYKSKYRDAEWERVSKQGGNVVTYFCTPQCEVLGWVVGPVSGEQLREGAEQAIGLHEDINDVSRSDEVDRRERVRDHFMDELVPANRQAMRVWSNDLIEVARIGETDVARVLKLAQQTIRNTRGAYSARTVSISKAVKLRNPAVRSELTRVRRMIESDELRMVLAELPLISLDLIRRPVFEQLAGQRFEPRTEANDKLLAAVQGRIARKQPTLLVLGEGILNLPYDLPPNPELEQLSRRFGIHKVSAKELTRLTDDLNQAPVERTNDYMRYVILNSAGERTAVITMLRNSVRSPYRSILSDDPDKIHRGGASLLLAEMKQTLATRQISHTQSTTSAPDGATEAWAH